jgi:hypothetical protein
MAFKVMRAEEVRDKYKKTRKSSVAMMAEWEALVEHLGKGFKKDDAAVIELKPTSKDLKDQKKTKSVQGNFKRNTRKYLKKHNLPYSVRSLRDEASGNYVVIVEHARKR